jgi:hypothetical protein
MDSRRRWFKMSLQALPDGWVCIVQPRENIGHDLGTVKKRDRLFFRRPARSLGTIVARVAPDDDCNAGSRKMTRKQ